MEPSAESVVAPSEGGTSEDIETQYGEADIARPEYTEDIEAQNIDKASPDQARPHGMRKKVGLISLLVLLLIVGVANGHAIGATITSSMEECAKLGWVAAVIVLLCTALLNVIMLPTLPLMLCAGAEFTKMYGLNVGAAVGIFASFGGLWLGSVSAFQLGRTLWKDLGQREQENRQFLTIINRMVDEEGVKIVFLARMTPLLPAELFNYTCSVTNLTLGQYSVGCLGSLVPVSFWVISAAAAQASAGGEGQSSDAKKRNVILIISNLVILAALTAILYRSFQNFRTRMEAPIPSSETHLERASPSTESSIDARSPR